MSRRRTRQPLGTSARASSSIAQVDLRFGEGTMVGASAEMRAVWEALEDAASCEVNVLLTGENGTGKDLLARTLHGRSGRRGGPFVTVNCCAVTTTLFEAELFGHERGAFSGAVGPRAGIFGEAHGGTLYLDEIGELPPELQAKLLRVVETRRLRRVGGNGEVPIDARLVAATNRDIDAEVAGGRFRADLFHRLATLRVELPPLRRRAGDIPLLAQEFLRRLARAQGRPWPRLDQTATAVLLAHAWPGNVRELENAMLQAALAARGAETIRVEHLPGSVRGAAPAPPASPGSPPASGLRTLAEVQRAHVLETLHACDGNLSRAAKILDIDRSTVQRMLKRYGDRSG